MRSIRSGGLAGRRVPARPSLLAIADRQWYALQRGSDWQELRHLSDDQCICVGYAQDTPATGYLPGALWAARRIAQALQFLAPGLLRDVADAIAGQRRAAAIH